MKTGEKLAKLRKEQNITQEQLAEMLNVSRQSISKWESDVAFPETEKLIKLSEIFNVTVDYLLKEENVGETKEIKEAKEETVNKSFGFHYEFTSKIKIGKLPLVHINIGLGRKAKGIIAIGLISKGIVSVGLLSMGVISLGCLSLGILALGVFSLGFLAIGSIALGIIALGAIAIGIFSVGALAIGQFSFGALAIGNYFAMGDVAYGKVAIGATRANGSVYESFTGIKGKYDYDAQQALIALKEEVPTIFKMFYYWVKNII